MASDEKGKGINRYGYKENIHLTVDDWAYRWEQNLIGFHSSETDRYLLKYESLLLDEENSVFVPLCGKTNDMIYLADKGHDVFGCEYVQKGVHDFFSENSIEYTCEVVDLGCCCVKEYKAKSKQITIYQGDFFSLSSDSVGKFEAIWDRASLIAIHPSKRQDYAEIILDLMCCHGKYLLNTTSMTGVNFTGPPYSASPNEVEELFGKFCDIKLLETTEEDPTFLTVATKKRHIFLLTMKEMVSDEVSQ